MKYTTSYFSFYVAIALFAFFLGMIVGQHNDKKKDYYYCLEQIKDVDSCYERYIQGNHHVDFTKRITNYQAKQ